MYCAFKPWVITKKDKNYTLNHEERLYYEELEIILLENISLVGLVCSLAGTTPQPHNHGPNFES